MTRSWTTLLAAITLLAGVGAAQPPAEREAPTDRGPAGAEASGERVRQRLQRRLDELERERERVARAIAALDEGRPLREIFRELRPEDRRFMEWRPGAPRGAERDPLAPETDAPPPTPEEIRAFIREHMPELTEKLDAVERLAPEEGRDRMIEALSPRIAEVIVAQRRDERLGQLKLRELAFVPRWLDAIRDARQLAAREGGLGQAEENALRTGLVELLQAQARIRDEVRLREIELLEERAGAMRAEVLARAEGRDEEIARMADRTITRVKRSHAPGDGPRDRRPGHPRAGGAED